MCINIFKLKMIITKYIFRSLLLFNLQSIIYMKKKKKRITSTVLYMSLGIKICYIIFITFKDFIYCAKF